MGVGNREGRQEAQRIPVLASACWLMASGDKGLKGLVVAYLWAELGPRISCLQGIGVGPLASSQPQ